MNGRMKEDMINGFMKESINKNGTDIYLNVLDRDSSDVIIVVHGFDSNKSGSVTASDYVIIKNYILKRANISQS